MWRMQLNAIKIKTIFFCLVLIFKKWGLWTQTTSKAQSKVYWFAKKIYFLTINIAKLFDRFIQFPWNDFILLYIWAKNANQWQKSVIYDPLAFLSLEYEFETVCEWNKVK